MIDQELQREQTYVANLYARLDALQREAEQQLVAVRRRDVGGNHQSGSERDTFTRLYAAAQGRRPAGVRAARSGC